MWPATVTKLCVEVTSDSKSDQDLCCKTSALVGLCWPVCGLCCAVGTYVPEEESYFPELQLAIWLHKHMDMVWFAACIVAGATHACLHSIPIHGFYLDHRRCLCTQSLWLKWFPWRRYMMALLHSEMLAPLFLLLVPSCDWFNTPFLIAACLLSFVGGTDSLMWGDEDGLGTPTGDMASICALYYLINLPILRYKYSLVCLYRTAFHSVNQSLFLENLAYHMCNGEFLFSPASTSGALLLSS